jgi:hypothetical protein
MHAYDYLSYPEIWFTGFEFENYAAVLSADTAVV